MGRLILFLAWASLAVVRMPLALGEGAVATEGALDDATMGEAVQFLDDEQKKGSMAAPVSETELEETAGLAAKEEGGEDGILELQGGASDVQAEAGGLDKCTITSPRGDWAAKWSTRKPRSNRDCRWSWSERTCVPEDMCHYKYQFLDATISESCRLRDYKTKRSVFATSDVEVKPAYAVAGATGLFASDVLAILATDWLQKFPLAFNTVQGFVLLFSGDAIFQVLEQGFAKKVGLRFWRMARSGLIGALNNGLVHYSYYKWIDRRFPYGMFSEDTWGPPSGARYKLAVGFTKWAIEWPTIGAYKIVSMYALTAVMSSSLGSLKDRLRDSFFLTWLRSLQVWPIYDMILYAYVPTAHRPLFNSFMSIAWGGYLSHVSQPDEGDDEDGGSGDDNAAADDDGAVDVGGGEQQAEEKNEADASVAVEAAAVATPE